MDHFKPQTVFKYKADHPKQKAVRNKMVEWVIESNRGLATVEDSKLVEAFKIADPKLKLPSAKTVKRDIKFFFKNKKQEFVKEASKVDYFGGTNDAGSSSDGRPFVVANVSYVTEDFILRKKILDVFEMPEAKNAKNYKRRLDVKRMSLELKKRCSVKPLTTRRP